jgi:hypothetical protein
MKLPRSNGADYRHIVEKCRALCAAFFALSHELETPAIVE